MKKQLIAILTGVILGMFLVSCSPPPKKSEITTIKTDFYFPTFTPMNYPICYNIFAIISTVSPEESKYSPYSKSYLLRLSEFYDPHIYSGSLIIITNEGDTIDVINDRRIICYDKNWFDANLFFEEDIRNIYPWLEEG